MGPTSLVAVYDRYLACLNSRSWNELQDYVDDAVVYNQERVGLSGYRAMLERDVRTIPDLRFVPALVLEQHDVLACRLEFRCTPIGSLFGCLADGTRTITFAEHVFYRFRDGKISEVDSLIDTRAIERALTTI